MPLLVLVLTWLFMTALANPVGDFPLNDDWVYGLAVRSLLETGRYAFPSATSANVGPQIYWGALFCLPFGFSFTALRLSSLTLGLVGVLFFYALTAKLTADRRMALLSAAALAVNPFYFGLANTFMTDVSFVALALASTYFLFIGLQRDSRRHVVVGVCLAVLVILVRQLGIVVLAAFVVARLAKSGWEFRRAAKGAALVVAGLAVHFGYQYWLVKTDRVPLLSVHASVQTLIPSSDNILSMIKTLTASFLYAGFLVVPFVVQFWFSKPNRPAERRSGRLFLGYGVLLAVVFAGLWRAGKLMPAAGNFLMQSGIGPLTLWDTYILRVNLPHVPEVASWAWRAVTMISLAAICTAVHLILKDLFTRRTAAATVSGQPRNWALILFATMALSYLLIMVLITGRVYIFDRYFLLFLPLLILIVCSTGARYLVVPPLGTWAAWSMVAIFAWFSVAATHDYLSWNRSRWIAAHELMADSKVQPRSIDGGYEFNGWFLYDAKYRDGPDRSWWWVIDNEYVISSGPLARYEEIRRYTFDHWLFGVPSSVFVLKRK